LYPALRQGTAGGTAYEEAVRGAVKIAHKLAGAAATYGFPTLTQAAAAFEDWAGGAAGAPPEGSRVQEFVGLIAELLDAARSVARDPVVFLDDPRFVALAGNAKRE
jgi:HPt (histidine-containing phosphotransfer) domain-containing protein